MEVNVSSDALFVTWYGAYDYTELKMENKQKLKKLR